MPKRSSICIGIVNSKGGAGKSTLCINLAIAFAQKGFKVLAVDADDQQSVCNWFSSTAENEFAQEVTAIHLGIKHLKSQLPKMSC